MTLSRTSAAGGAGLSLAKRRHDQLGGSIAAKINRQVNLEPGALAQGTVDQDCPAQRLHPVGEADQPGAVIIAGPADAVVTHQEL